ncbi:MAG: glucose-1-phosphate thymidylyltransferase [Acidimicrobiia bacterium]
MKALVLAGGAGTRLRPITYTSAKQLVPLANRPIIAYGLDAIAASGITEVGIIVNDPDSDIQSAIGDGSKFGIQATYIVQDAPRGLAHAVLIARDFLGDDPFVMYLGDNVVIGGIAGFVDQFCEGGMDALVLLTRVENPRQFGVAAFNADGSLQYLVEKPKDPPSDMALVGVYLFDPKIHDAVRAIAPSARGELEITDAIQWLIDQGHTVRPHTLTTPWIDTGKLQDLLEANRIVLESVSARVHGEVDAQSRIAGQVVIEPGATVIESSIRGPVVIGAGARIERSYVGPFTSIADGCQIIDSELEHSVLLENVRVEGVARITDSLIGRSAVVQRGSEQPKAIRMHIGDDSDVSVPF